MLQTFNVVAGGRQIDTKATFFRYESSSATGGDETIRVRANGSDLGTYLPGDALELTEGATRWEVTPVDPALTVVVRLGLGRVTSARLLGLVRVIDQSSEKTLAGRQFIGSSSHPGSATEFAFGALSALSRPLSIRQVFVQSATAGDVNIGHALNSGTRHLALASNANKNAGGTASTSLKAGFTVTADPPPAAELDGYQGFTRLFIPANQAVLVPLPTPIVIPVGRNFNVSTRQVNRDISMVVDYEEL